MYSTHKQIIVGNSLAVKSKNPAHVSKASLKKHVKTGLTCYKPKQRGKVNQDHCDKDNVKKLTC